jgi:hypothetical protein
MVERQLAQPGLLFGQHIEQRPLGPIEIFHLFAEGFGCFGRSI